MNRKINKIVLLIIPLIILFVIFRFNTFSRFKSNKVGNGQLQIAKWDIVVNNQTSNISIDLEDTLAENTFSATSVIPGTNGVFILNLDFSEMDVSADYTISIDSSNSNLPALLKLYSDSSYTKELPYSGTYNVSDGSNPSIYVYWKWVYADFNENNWMDSDIFVTLNLVVSQKISG